MITKVKDGHLIEFDEATSVRMRGIRRTGTKPEMVVRALLTALGHRYRVRNGDLPGSPDLANRSRGWAVFVHGCYWHRHGCSASTIPTRNREFWLSKFSRNTARDRSSVLALESRGFRVIVVWECETKRLLGQLAARLSRELQSGISTG